MTRISLIHVVAECTYSLGLEIQSYPRITTHTAERQSNTELTHIQDILGGMGFEPENRLIGYRTSHCEAKVAPVVGKIAIGLFAYAFSRMIQPRDKTAPVSCDCSYRPGGEIIQCIGASGPAVFASLGSIDGDLSKAFSG